MVERSCCMADPATLRRGRRVILRSRFLRGSLCFCLGHRLRLRLLQLLQHGLGQHNRQRVRTG